MRKDELGAHAIEAGARRVDGVSDAVLISNRDGLHFERPFLEAFLRPGLDPLNWGNAPGNYTHVKFPADVKNCTACHVDDR